MADLRSIDLDRSIGTATVRLWFYEQEPAFIVLFGNEEEGHAILTAEAVRPFVDAWMDAYVKTHPTLLPTMLSSAMGIALDERTTDVGTLRAGIVGDVAAALLLEQCEDVNAGLPLDGDDAAIGAV